jgi:hypothetical protein
MTHREIKAILARQLQRLDRLSDDKLRLISQFNAGAIADEQLKITSAMCAAASALNGLMEAHVDIEDGRY